MSEEAPFSCPSSTITSTSRPPPDVVVLRRQDGAFVAAFSARGATEEGIAEAAKDDYRALLEEPAGPLDLESESLRSQSA